MRVRASLLLCARAPCDELAYVLGVCGVYVCVCVCACVHRVVYAGVCVRARESCFCCGVVVEEEHRAAALSSSSLVCSRGVVCGRTKFGEKNNIHTRVTRSSP